MLSVKEQSILGADRAARVGWGLGGACTVGGALEEMQEDRPAENALILPWTFPPLFWCL